MVTRAAYYKWVNRLPTEREIQNKELIKAMTDLHEEVEGIYGYRRLKMNMNRQFKKKFNHKRIQRLMKVAGIKSVIRKKKYRYKPSVPQQVAENLLNREFKATKPNEKWVTDVTEFKYGQSQKAYLSAIRDVYDGSIVSYVISHRNNNLLVFQTLDLAIARLKEGEHPLLHSDRGFQYTSYQFKQKLDKAKMTHSMSRVGKCIDNAPQWNRFGGTLKCEKYYLHTYKTFEELSKDINNYIYFYNHHRYQEKLNDLSPMEYRTKIA
ncbi:mobile element protein [Gracilibacillus boraciitolerans JCM 21714]|uniref:Mobile element protein n=2 Tax=Gracilibacillus boraciitolerans TaxID=307521 RepID=W4VR18_9BACI|nr:mobile element protein [Gracilibacillus boraciitolerans JCM 21714]